jgi:hypothetical protein
LERERCVKRISEGKPAGKWRVGRPRLRWLNGVENDLRITEVKRWGNTEKVREKWH